MDFIQTANKQTNKFGSGKHGFKPGNPGTGELATFLSNEWCDTVQQEIVNVIEAVAAINPASKTQLRDAIQIMTGFKFKQQFVISTPTTLTAAAHAGAEITIVGATPVTLPPASTCPQGSLIQFWSASGGAFVVLQSGDVFSNAVTTAFNLDANDSLLLMSDGGNNWIYIGGSAVLRYATTTGQRAGEICIFARDTPPLGFLKANGALVSRSSYAHLFDVIGVNFGAGDGSTTFALPDLRGEFIRFWDDGRGIDPGRAIFTFQADQFKSHTHTTGYANNGSGGSLRDATWSFDSNLEIVDTGSTGGTETRPRNVAYLACIKY